MATFSAAAQEGSLSAMPRLALSYAGRGVCRSLFGPIDHDELRSDLNRRLKEIQASDCQRWNFDFDSGAPLKGTFCWEPLESKEVPSFYRESRLCPATSMPSCRLSVPLCTRPLVIQEDSREDSSAEAIGTRENPKCAKENADRSAKRCQGVKGPSKASARLRKRENCTLMTDYFPQRKRQFTETDSQKTANAICTLEQTPRKKIR